MPRRAPNPVALGDSDEALATADNTAPAVAELDVPAHRAMYLRARAEALAATGRTAEAAAGLQRVVDLREAIGDRKRADVARQQLAELSSPRRDCPRPSRFAPLTAAVHAAAVPSRRLGVLRPTPCDFLA